MERLNTPTHGPRRMGRLAFILWTFAFLGAAFLLLRLLLDTTVREQGAFPDLWQFLDPLGMIFSSGAQLHWTLAIHLLLSGAFVIIGIRRARDANWSPWMGAMMALPVVRLFIFTALAVAPGKATRMEEALKHSPILDRLLPSSKRGSAVASILLAVALMLPLAMLDVKWLEHYGLALFIGLPFLLGAASAFLFGFRHKQRIRASLGVAALAMTFAFLVIFIIAMEGAVCILMALPVAYPVALAGALVGHALSHSSTERSSTLTAMLLAVPGLMAFETVLHPPLPLYSVTTRVLVQAPAQRIWDSMIAFSHIDAPLDLAFKAGISYPTEARIEGSGAGAIRYCQFNTGPFVEPITAWDEPHRLAFAVKEQPPPMVEFSVYEHIDAPHIKGFFQSRRGEIKIAEVGDGASLLEGTTWYTHDIWPGWYWNMWSREILYLIHYRVLDHIKRLSEARGPDGASIQDPSTGAISGRE